MVSLLHRQQSIRNGTSENRPRHRPSYNNICQASKLTRKGTANFSYLPHLSCFLAICLSLRYLRYLYFTRVSPFYSTFYLNSTAFHRFLPICWHYRKLCPLGCVTLNLSNWLIKLANTLGCIVSTGIGLGLKHDITLQSFK